MIMFCGAGDRRGAAELEASGMASRYGIDRVLSLETDRHERVMARQIVS